MVDRQVDADFQRKLDQFNDSQGGPSQIAVAWNNQSGRWQIYAVPVQDSHHPLARQKNLLQLMRTFPDGSDRRGVLLFTWQDDKNGYLPLDDRLFHALHWADSFSSRRHFEETIDEPEFKKELALKKNVREMTKACANYWYTLDRLAINPHIKGPGDWRHRYR